MTMRAKTKFSYSLVLITLGLSISYLFSLTKTESTTRNHLKTLTQQERTSIHNFYKVPVFMSGFGYTIFGEKPMSMTTIKCVKTTKNLEKIDYMVIEHIFDQHRLWKDWKVWQKYSHLFPLKGFSIIHYTSPLYPLDCIEVAIMNEKSFIQTVSEHLTDFQSVIGRSLTARQIFDGYLQGEGEIFESIRYHDGLFGTLLGYGRGNAWEYLSRSGGMTMDSFMDPGEVIHTKDVLPPLFAVISESEETIQLKIKYTAEKEKLNKIYQSDDFLEQVLNRLTGQVE